MTYTTDIPISGDSLGGTRDRIRANFQLINSVLAVNHAAFNTLNAGKHNFLQVPELSTQTPTTPPTTAVNECALYSNVGANPAETNLYFRGENNGFNYQLTRAYSSYTSSFANTSGTGTSGWTFLPGGMILAYGSKSSPGTSGSITFPVVFTNPPYSIQVSLYRGSAGQIATIDSGTPPTTTQFNYLTSSGGSTSLFWMAIGV